MIADTPRRIGQTRFDARHGSTPSGLGQHSQDDQAQAACFRGFGGHVLVGRNSHAGNNARRAAAVTANSRFRVAEVAR